MTVASETPIDSHTANGSTSVFAYNFRIEAESELSVYIDSVLQVSGFSVSGVGLNGGGAVTFTSNPSSGSIVLLLRSMPTTRSIDYQNSGDFASITVNEDLDRIWLKIQEIGRNFDYRLLQFPETEPRTPSINSLPSAQTGKIMQWQADGSLANYDPVSAITASDAETYDSIASAILGDNTGLNYIKTLAYYSGWASTTTGPKGGALYHRDGTTGTASTVYSDQTGFYDANGDGFSLSVYGPVNVYQTGAKGNGTDDDSIAFTSAISQGTSVYVQTGNFAINIDINEKVIIFGDGSMKSRVTPFNTSNAAMTYTFTAQQNPIYRFWDYNSEIRGIGFYSTSQTGIGFAFGDDDTSSYSSNDELANNVKFYACHFELLDKGVQFSFGNIGSEFYSCGFRSNNYGVYSLNNKFGSLMHAGNKHFYGGEFNGNLCSVYIHNGTAVGYGDFAFDHTIFEQNNICFYLYIDSTSLANPALSLNGVWFEANGTNISGGTTATQTIDSWSGSTKSTQSVDTHAVIIDGDNVYVDVVGGGLIGDWHLKATNSYVMVENAFGAEDSGNGSADNVIDNPESASIVYEGCFGSATSQIAQTDGSYLKDSYKRQHVLMDSSPTNSASRWWRCLPRTNIVKANPPSLQVSIPCTKQVSLGNGSFSLSGSIVNDGVCYGQCNEFTRAAFATSEFVRVNGPEDTSVNLGAGYHVMTFAAKMTSGAVKFYWWDRSTLQAAGPIAAASNGDWANYISIVKADGSGAVYLDVNGTGVDATWRMADIQIHSFDNVYEAEAFAESLTFVEREITASTSYDPPSLADGAGVTTTVTATGALLGDVASASFSLDLQGIQVTAWVSAADTVSVRFQNETGGTLDLSAGVLYVRVNKN